MQCHLADKLYVHAVFKHLEVWTSGLSQNYPSLIRFKDEHSDILYKCISVVLRISVNKTIKIMQMKSWP